MVVAPSHQLEMFGKMCYLIYQLLIRFRFVVGPLSQFQIQPFDLLFHFLNMTESLFRFFTDSTAVGQLHLLRQIADRRFFGNTHRTGCWRLQTCKYLQHRRFSRPVLTDQCDTILLVYHKRNIIKKRKSAKFNC